MDYQPADNDIECRLWIGDLLDWREVEGDVGACANAFFLAISIISGEASIPYTEPDEPA